MFSRAARGWALALALLSPAAAGVVGAAREARAAAPAAPQPAESYLIRLTRPVPVGQKYHYTANATVVQSLTADVSGQTRTLLPRSLSIRFEGVEEVLAVNNLGEPTKVVYTVERCTSREGKKEVNVVQPGLQITVEADKWKSRMDISQGALTIQDEMMLRPVVSLPAKDGVSDDECYGTLERQKVGDSWPARPEALARSYSASGVKVKVKDTSGTVKLKDLDTSSEGLKCLRIQGKSEIKHFLPPATDLPPGMKVKDSTLEYKFTKQIPVDLTGHSLSDSYSSTLLLKMKTDDPSIGSDVSVNGKLLTTVGIKRVPIRG
jgi:hypothetical protein